MGARLVAQGTLLVASCVVVATLDDPIASYPIFVAAVGAATIAWLAAVRGAARGPGGRRVFLFVAGVSVLARSLLLVPDVPLSDDLYRYLWDGRVANAGINPFLHAPASPALRELRDEAIWPHINHPHIPTIYPPAAQVLFAGLDRVAPTPRGARGAAALFDLVTFVSVASILRRRGRPPALALAHGWCPVAILESAGGGHVDAFGAALLVLGLAWLDRERARAALGGGLALGLSALVKPVSVLLGPAALRGREPRTVGIVLVAAAVPFALLLPYAEAGTKLFAGFRAYAEHWRFNDCFYSILVQGGLSPRGARVVLGIALLGLAVAIPRRVRDPLAAAAVVVGAFLLLSPTVHPWYASWIVPLLPFAPGAVRPAGIALVALLPVSYASAWSNLSTDAWTEPAWTRPVLWLPVLALLGIGLIRSRRKTRAADRGSPTGRSSRGS